MVYNLIRLCVDICYPNYYANVSGVCVVAASCPSAPVAYFGDGSTGKCVTSKQRSMQNAQSTRGPTRTTQPGSASSTAPSVPSQTQSHRSAWQVIVDRCRMSLSAQSLRQQRHPKLHLALQLGLVCRSHQSPMHPHLPLRFLRRLID